MRARVEELVLRFPRLPVWQRLLVPAALVLVLGLAGRPAALRIAGQDPAALRSALDSLVLARVRLAEEVSGGGPLTPAEREQLESLDRGVIWPRHSAPLSRADVLADLAGRAERAGVWDPVITDWAPHLEALRRAGRSPRPGDTSSSDTTALARTPWVTATGFQVLGVECSFTADAKALARFLETLQGGPHPYLIVELSVASAASGSEVRGVLRAVTLTAPVSGGRGAGAAK